MGRGLPCWSINPNLTDSWKTFSEVILGFPKSRYFAGGVPMALSKRKIVRVTRSKIGMRKNRRLRIYLKYAIQHSHLERPEESTGGQGGSYIGIPQHPLKLGREHC